MTMELKTVRMECLNTVKKISMDVMGIHPLHYHDRKEVQGSGQNVVNQIQ